MTRPQPGTTGGYRNQLDDAGEIGTVVQAGAVHGDVHLYAPPPASLGQPMMLPAAPHRLRDRRDERQLLSRIATARRPPARPDLLVITGPPGVGTTALALDVAHRAIRAGTAPGGALWADLTPAPAAEPATGPGPSPASPGPARQGGSRVAAAAACWLRFLGAPWIPDHPDEAAALLRSLTASRPVVAVIERASTAEQVRALLPAAGLVVVTSRVRLDLGVDGAEHLQVPPLPEDAAVELAADLIGTRATSDPAGVRALVTTCGALPGAVIAAAAYVAALPHRPIVELAERLAQRPPRRTSSPSPTTSEEKIVNSIYDGLQSDLQDAYRSLALMPRTVFSTSAAAALLQVDDETTDMILAGLRQAHLLDYEDADQWQMPARVRPHAAGLVADHPADDRTAAVARVARHWLLWSAQLDLLITPDRRRHAAVFGWHPERAPVADTTTNPIAMIQGWIPTLLSVQAAAADVERHDLAWQFADTLWGYVTRRQDYAAWRWIVDVALDSAAQIGDAGALARVHALAGLLDRWLGNYDDAVGHHTETARLARLAGDTLTQASAGEHYGATLIRMGRPDEAHQVLTDGLALYRALSTHPRGEALLRRQLGIAWSHLGDLDKAMVELSTAAAVFRGLAEPYPQSQLAVDCAEAAARAGQLDQALESLNQADQLLPSPSDAHDAYRHYLRADFHGRAGDGDAAREALAAAIRCADRLPDDHPTVKRIRALVEERSDTA
ncbi:hypothetical protein ACGFJT_42015 [Actinomadura geliboluensis]|uniref:hypothetical protein n=1 Tax=Actinomadura geliboluensis TaxID=882440 RepID=UPI003720AC36